MNKRDQNTLLRLREKTVGVEFVSLTPAQVGALQRAAREAEHTMDAEERAAFVRVGLLPAVLPC